MNTPTSRRSLVAAGLFAVLVACGGGSSSNDEATGPTYNEATALLLRQAYADLMFSNYSDIKVLTLALDVAIDAFIATPDETNLTAAKNAWLAARPYYIQSEIGRFYDGPIDNAVDGPEGFINAWPLDEVFIDYVQGMANAGIINDTVTYPTLDANTIRTANEQGGEANISTGWHAIEFLLWGQDLILGATPGMRPATDYVTSGGGTAANQDRRAMYLGVVSDLLVADIQFLCDAWDPNMAGNYRSQWLALTSATALSRVMTGMGTLAFGELRGERLLVPFTTKLAEDEHSCFSDTTHLDHLNDLVGIRNAWFGTYTSSNGANNFAGTGLREVAASANQNRANEITQLLDEALALLQSSVLNPFETAVAGADTTPGRMQLQAIMDKLNEFNLAFSALASEMGVNITTTL